MDLTKDEKKLIVDLLDIHLKELKDLEKLPGQEAKSIGAEVKYEDMIKGIMKKLK